jgi:hypothetical protein
LSFCTGWLSRSFQIFQGKLRSPEWKDPPAISFWEINDDYEKDSADGTEDKANAPSGQPAPHFQNPP